MNIVKNFEVEINYIRLCPYCREREIIEKTCHNPLCQYEHHKKLMRIWWKGPGKVFNGRRKTYLKDRRK